jgi:hypothetical protein
VKMDMGDDFEDVADDPTEDDSEYSEELIG